LNSIDFKNEMRQMAKSICYTPCKATGLAFSISQNALRGPFRAGVGVADCNEDFMLIANGYDKFNKGQRNDRFCGTIFNPNGNVTANHADQIAAGSTTICCNVNSIMRFELLFNFLIILQPTSNRSNFTTRQT
jgi:hypothetical protein